jgi:hypothetical protein
MIFASIGKIIVMTAASELQQTLHTLRHTLAQKRAARKIQNDAQLSEFAPSSSHNPSVPATAEEQTARASLVLGQLHSIAQTQQATDNRASVPVASPTEASAATIAAPAATVAHNDSHHPDAQELLAFRKALLGN